MAVKEVDFKEALEFARKHGSKLVWLGREPVEYIRDLLNLDESKLIAENPQELIRAGKEKAMSLKNHVMVCYHGNTSRYVANALKDSWGVETLNMKGGVTAIVGEIF